MTEVLMWHSKKPRRSQLRGFSIPFGKAFMVMLPARLIKNVIKAPVDSIILYLVMTVLERAGVFRMLKIFRPGKSGVWRQEKISGFDKK